MRKREYAAAYMTSYMCIILYEGLSKFSYPLECSYINGNANQTLGIRCLDVVIIEYGSTLYVGMARKKMAAACTLYKLLRSELCSRCSHKPL